MNDLFSILLASRPEARPSAPAAGTCKRLSQRQPSRAQFRARSQLVHEQNFAGFAAAQPFAKTLPLPYSFVTKAIAKFLTNRVGGIPRTISVIFALASILSASADDMPYHPYRQIAGRYCDLRPVYLWRESYLPKRHQADLEMQGAAVTGSSFDRAHKLSEEANELERRRPLPEWIGATETFAVSQVWSNRLILCKLGNSPIVVTNHPLHDFVTDGDKIQFLAVPLFDYGIPYDPVALSRNKTNSITPRKK